MGEFSASLAAVRRAAKLTVNVGLKGTEIANKWNIWAYPTQSSTSAMPSDVVISDAWGESAKTALAAGKKVILFQRSFRTGEASKGSFKPVFWSPVWFAREPATMGILVNPDHPLFSEFPTDLYSDWQWYSLIEGSYSVVLDNCPQNYRPVVQVIDNFARNHRLGSVFEARVGKGQLLVCTLNLNHDSTERQTPEQRAMLASISNYVDSSMFAPSQHFAPNFLDGLLMPGA